MQQPHLLKKLISCLFLLPLMAAAQDITGLWKGTLYNDTTKETLRFEIGIGQEKGKLMGFSHTFIQHEDKLYFAIKKIKVKQKGGKIIIEDLGLLHNSSPLLPPKGVNKTCVLDLEMMDSMMVLSGPFATNRTKEYHVLTGRVYLERKNDYYQSDLLSRLTELRLANANNFEPLAFMEKTSDPSGISANSAPTLAINTVKAPGTTLVVPDKVATEEPIVIETKLEKINGAIATEPMAMGKTAPAPAVAVGKKSVAVDSFPPPEIGDGPVLTKINGAVVQTGNPTKPALAKAATLAGSQGVAVTVKQPIITFEPASELNDRLTETLETVTIESDSLQLTLYDNGEVDGDTVSVLLNGQLIMPKQGLSTRAVKKTIYMQPGTETLQLVMYAENLGSIPPNTGLLVVHDGEKIYEIRFSADMKKNAAIVFKRKR